MGWTKRQLIVQAFESIGLASYVFDLSPEQLESALRQLDGMMATWNFKGIRVGYAGASTPSGSSLDTASGLPDSATEAVYTNLALRLAPTVGKTVPPELRLAAKQGYDVLLSLAARPPTMQMPRGMPAGAGHKSRNETIGPFLDPPSDDLDAGPDAELDFE